MRGRSVRRLLYRRALQAIPVLLIVICGAFALLEAAPGDAVDAYAAITGGDVGAIADLRRVWGLDQSLASRFLSYLLGVMSGDLGWSVAFSRPVLAVISERIGNTVLLMTASICFAFGFGVPLGVWAGAKPGSRRDGIISTLALTLYAVPGFWLGLMLLVVFAVKLMWLPLGGISTIGGLKGGALSPFWDVLCHLILPTTALGVSYLALYVRLMRSGMVEVWQADYIRTARAKGLRPHRLLWRHVVRNALLPVVTMLGVQAGAMLGGSVVIESVFAIPGLGRLAFEAVTQRDIPLLLGIVIASAVLVIVVNLIVDLLYARLDPRIGEDGGP